MFLVSKMSSRASLGSDAGAGWQEGVSRPRTRDIWARDSRRKLRYLVRFLSHLGRRPVVHAVPKARHHLSGRTSGLHAGTGLGGTLG